MAKGADEVSFRGGDTSFSFGFRSEEEVGVENRDLLKSGHRREMSIGLATHRFLSLIESFLLETFLWVLLKKEKVVEKNKPLLNFVKERRARVKKAL